MAHSKLSKSSMVLLAAVLVSAYPLARGLGNDYGRGIGGDSDRSPSAPSGSEQAPGVNSTPDYEPFQIPLLGEDVLSESINMSTIAPPGGWRVRWDGPSSALAHWDDGSVGPLAQYWGAKGGEVRFSGPAGEAVTIYVLPPS